MKLIRTFFWVALVAAIYQELKKQPEERTWHGKVAGRRSIRLPRADAREVPRGVLGSRD